MPRAPIALAPILAILLALPSCSAGGRPADLVVLTTLDPSQTARLETTFLDWLGDPAGAGGTTGVRWVRPRPGDDPADLLARGSRPDLLLGGPPSSFRRLDRAGLLAPLEPGPRWRVYRREPIGVATRATAAALPTFDDPRRSPLSLAWMESRLRSRGWSAGYRGLLKMAGRPPSVGLRDGDSMAKLSRGEADAAPAQGGGVPLGVKFVAEQPTASWREGVAIVRGGPREAAARRFVAFLESTTGLGVPADAEEEDGAPFLTVLLGATMVDAQPELIDAERALDRSGHPPKAEGWMAPPPWPPASITRLREADPSGALVETLAEQVVPDFAARVWLTESWKRPPRPVDADLLRELATAAGGRLRDEPRLRAWLAVEWTAWARQRYRLVSRELGRGPG